MKKLILLLLMALGSGSLMAQKKLLEKMMAAQAPTTIEFFSDETCTQPITSIQDGDYEFYAKVPIKKNLAKKAGNYTDISFSMQMEDSRKVYGLFKDIEITMAKIAKGIGHLTLTIDLKNREDAYLFWLYVEKEAAEDINLSFQLKAGMNRSTLMATGAMTLELSKGKSDYMNFILADKKDFVFDRTDKFSDENLKAELISAYKTKGINIYDFAWGERVEYKEGLTNYRRQTALITFKDKENKCYVAGLKAFTDTPYPRSDYSWDGTSTTYHNAALVPCDKIM